MKKYTKLLLVAFLFLTISSIAQENFQFRPNNKRTLQQQAIEKDIQAFIAENLSKYELTPERIAQLKESIQKEEKLHGHSHQHLLPSILNEIKKQELRELYYSLNNLSSFNLKEFRIDDETRFICDNGGFEERFTDDYFFDYFEADYFFPFTCVNMELDSFEIETGYDTPFTPAQNLNNFNHHVTLVDADDNVSDGVDPVLLSEGISISRVNTGLVSMKLNNNTPIYGVTSMSKLFTVSSSSVSYYFSLIVENPSNHGEEDQPHFIVRLYNEENVLISSSCIIANVENTSLFFNARDENQVPLLYTGWQCASLSTGDMAVGETGRLEFIITDCGQGQHYGTVYIDDICDSTDCESPFGQVNLTPFNTPNCPNLPVNICGTYTLPHSVTSSPVVYGTIATAKLEVIQNGNIVATLTNPLYTGTEQFCFTLNDSDFTTVPTGDYELRVEFEFDLEGEGVVREDISANTGPDLSFNGCVPTPPCVDYLLVSDPVLSPNEEEREANVQVIAENIVNSGAIVYYHGGEEVILKEGFDGLYGSTGHYYITGCDSISGVARPAVAITHKTASRVNTIDLVEVQKAGENLKIYPNPAANELNIVASAGKIRSFNLVSLDGKLVLSQQTVSESHKLDISSLAKGIYLLTVEMDNGEVTSHKVVKE